MWSRWYNLNDEDVLQLVDDYENRGLPLDNFILDSKPRVGSPAPSCLTRFAVDWHTKYAMVQA